MNNKKYILLSSIILVLTIILICCIILQNKGYSLPKLKNIDSNISEIKINKGTNESIILSMKNNDWTVNNKYKANSKVIENLIDDIKKIEPVEIISRGNSESIDKYKLKDDEVIQLIVLDNKSKEVRNLRFGMKANFANSVYSQIDNDKNIYLLGNTTQNPRDIFDKDENFFINKTISYIKNDDINKINIEYNNKIYSIEKNNETNWVKTWKNNEVISVNDLYSATFAIANLESDGILEANTSNNTDSLYKIEIFTKDNVVSYNILNKNSSDIYEIILINDTNRYYLKEVSLSNIKESIDKIIF